MILSAKRKKRVLLIADVGTRANGYYHVGDEAMLYQNYLLYRQAADFDQTLLSWTISHDYLDVDERPSFQLRAGEAGLAQAGALLAQIERRRRLAFPPLPAELKEYVEIMREQDLIHIIGGGNLNSLYPRGLCTRALVLLLADALHKPVLVTGQTIGPFNQPGHQALARRALDLAKIITVRDPSFSEKTLKALGVHKPQIRVGLDDAFFLEPAAPDAIEPFWLPDAGSESRLRVGVSIHTAENAALQTRVARALEQLARHFPIQVYFIPHHLVNNDQKFDVPFMRGIAAQIPAEIPCRVITRRDLIENAEPVKERLVKGLTAAMDVVLATRYHALVFALSSGVPALALNHSEYTRIKNLGLLEILFAERAADYAVSIDELEVEALAGKLRQLLAQRATIRAALRDQRAVHAGESQLNLALAKSLLQLPRAA